jgi:hypothetical protein
MERKIITINDFQNVARDNEYFLWHFLQKNQENSYMTFYSYFKQREDRDHKLKELIDLVKMPYFESYTEDSIDFLNGLGISYEKLWTPLESMDGSTPLAYKFSPVIIAFKKFTKISSTLESCYCIESILNMITELNPEILLSVNTED